MSIRGMPIRNIAKRGAAALFQLGVEARSKGYDAGFLKSLRVEGIAVISVGNLAVGGSGKTPFTMFLTRKLQALGKRVAVISRGYKGDLETRGGIASIGDGPILSVEECGDEARLSAERLPGAGVYVGADRVRSVMRARKSDVEVAVLDDGFSHLRLHRDLDILLAAKSELHEDAAFFPLGDLRESPKAAARAHLVGGFEEDWKDEKPDFTFRYVPTCLVDVEGVSHPSAQPPVDLCKAHLVSGIARPHRFEKTAKEAGFAVCGRSVFPDHHRFSSKDILRIFRDAAENHADLVLTTEKDGVRLPKTKFPLPLFALRVEIEVVFGEEKLDEALRNLFG